jgi:hypothetical protein
MDSKIIATYLMSEKNKFGKKAARKHWETFVF